ncbi:MAG: hypothetical protein WCP53_16130, partial [Verrucomicrobiota bacterium]
LDLQGIQCRGVRPVVSGEDEAQRLTHDIVMPKPTIKIPSRTAGRSGVSLPKQPGSTAVSSHLNEIP